MTAQNVPFDRKDVGPRPCPICGKPSTATVAPFCSKRCADVDLHRWLSGKYVVPSDEPGQPDAVPAGD